MPESILHRKRPVQGGYLRSVEIGDAQDTLRANGHMQLHASSIDQPWRIGSAALSVAVSGVMFGLLMTLGWHSGGGPSGPVLTVLSASQFAVEASSAQRPEELRAEPASKPAPPRATPQEEARPEDTPATSAPAPGPASEKPAAVLVSASSAAIEKGGAEATVGRGRKPGDAAAADTATATSGTTQPESAASGGSGDAYGRAVFARIKARQSFVEELARAGIEGSVALAFLVDPRGRVRDERVAATSGNQRLDRIALDQLRDAAPFPAPPHRRERAFTIRLTYRQARHLCQNANESDLQ